MKKLLVMLLIVLLSLGMMTGCGGSSDDEVLNIYNWGFYMDPDILDAFTAETGIEIVYEEYATNEDMYVKVKAGAGNYDLIFPSDYMVEKMINEDLLLPIDYSGMEYIDQIDPDLMGLDYDPTGEYSVPYTWGTIGIAYNTTMVDEEVNSYDILFSGNYTKKIIMQDSSRDALAVALIVLGYDINTTSLAELEEAKNLLIEQKSDVLAYVVDEVRDMMLAGEAALAVVWSGEGMYLEDASDGEIQFVLPDGEGNIFVDAVAIPVTAQNQDYAEMFIDFINRPDNAAAIADYIGYATPNLGAQEVLGEEVTGNENNYPTAERIEELTFFCDPSDMAADYARVWTEIFSN